MRDEAGVIQKFGVSPVSIPDYLALVGDAADGYPGLPGWGAKSSAAVLARFVHLESIRRWRAIARHAAAIRTHCEKGDLACRRKQRQALLHWAYDSRTI